MKGWMYILKCSDESYYTGSTIDLPLRYQRHQEGKGANHTRKHLPVKLIYFESFGNIKLAFEREKQIQGWNRKKKEALIRGNYQLLKILAKNYTEHKEEIENAWADYIS